MTNLNSVLDPTDQILIYIWDYRLDNFRCAVEVLWFEEKSFLKKKSMSCPFDIWSSLLKCFANLLTINCSSVCILWISCSVLVRRQFSRMYFPLKNGWCLLCGAFPSLELSLIDWYLFYLNSVVNLGYKKLNPSSNTWIEIDPWNERGNWRQFSILGEFSNGWVWNRMGWAGQWYIYIVCVYIYTKYNYWMECRYIFVLINFLSHFE